MLPYLANHVIEARATASEPRPLRGDCNNVPGHDRLVIDLAVSETSPIVKGTWVTVDQVVSLILDGWTWDDILDAHPELTYDDIRACLAYHRSLP